MRLTLHFVVPGSLSQRTGGYIYDRKIVEGLRDLGWPVKVHELAGRFPDANDEALNAASLATEEMAGGLPIIDGLALPAFWELTDRLPRPWVGLIHHPLAMETGLSEAEVASYVELESRLMAGAEKLIVTSPMTKRNLKGFDVDPAKVAAVLPGVEPAAPAAGLAERLPKSLLCVGTLTKRKGHLVLLQALAQLQDLDWHLTMVGSAAWDPDHAGRIDAMIDDLGLSSRITVVGEQDEAGLSGFYDRADLFALASHHEGYGMVLAEALARGLPIVSTTAGAIPDTVREGAGRLVPPGDVEAFACALRDAMTDRQLYASLKEHALRARDALPDWKESARRFGLELEKVIGA